MAEKASLISEPIKWNINPITHFALWQEVGTLPIFVISILVLAIAYCLSRRRSHGRLQLAEHRTDILKIGVQIICGDCSGEEDRPQKTYLDIFGNCAQCGGRSYVLAHRMVYSQQLNAAPLTNGESDSRTARILPFMYDRASGE